MNAGGTATANGGVTGETPLRSNATVEELFALLKGNDRATAGFSALINHIEVMEDFAKHADECIINMKSQLDTMKEAQDHPIRTALQKTIAALEEKVAEIRAQIAVLKTNVIEGCKKAVTAFKQNGSAALNKLASFFRVKGGLQAIKNDAVRSMDDCDRAVAKIEAFSQNYHMAGRGFKNMVRIAVGRQPIDAVKESGKLAKAVSAPYRAQKACMNGIRKQCDKMIASLDKLEASAEGSRQRKPTIKERMEEKREHIRRLELEKPSPEGGLKKAGHEV